MKEIDLVDLLKYLKKKIFIILGIFLILLVVGTIISKLTIKTMYSNYVNILIIDNEKENKNVNTNKELVNTYIEIIKSDDIIDEIFEKSTNFEDKDEIKDNLNITQVLDTEVIEISFSNEKEKNVNEFLEEYIITITDKIQNIYDNIELKIIDDYKNNEIEIVTKKISFKVVLFLSIILPIGIMFLSYLIKQYKKENKK